jgi:hypothetical protein
VNELKRFYTLGAESADRRVAAALTPPPLEAADRYLRASKLVTAIDGMTLRLRDWRLSREATHWSAIAGRFAHAPLAVRRKSIALLLLVAVVVHISLVSTQGAHIGGFWLTIPAMVALFAVVLLAASRSASSTD